MEIILNQKQPKCKHCNKSQWDHKAKSLHCPTGTKTRIGYLSYHLTNTFKTNEKT